ncbi:hypothetical protein [Pseudomonas sp. B28(2017)]|uniref:hypothetical protein n=1 Tax=Pseudomonas sp. B28(2017) TaxID=1981730 RepID=UPI000A1D81C1|nr:hypothetical protein [Pseudomonas sp. B28(2017)]
MIAIKERPILFSAPMVRAILAGHKTVTRRPVRHQPDVSVTDAIPRRNFPHGPATIDWYWRPKHGHLNGAPSAGWDFKCPYGQPGDRLWVREAWAADAQVDAISPRELSQGEPILYPADGTVRQTGCSMLKSGRTRPSIHMPRWVSRILLEITDVRVERLQDISLAQVRKEGCEVREFWLFGSDAEERQKIGARVFGNLWASINGEESWRSNPWAWVIEFKRVTP